MTIRRKGIPRVLQNPGVVSAPEISAGRVALSWPAASDNVGVARYRIYRNGSMIAESGETSYVDTALPDPGQYCYSVSAIDQAGNESEQSQPACADVSPQPDCEPSVPAGVSASLADSGVRITWSASIDNKAVAGYRIFRNGVKISDITETSLAIPLFHQEQDTATRFRLLTHPTMNLPRALKAAQRLACCKR